MSAAPWLIAYQPSGHGMVGLFFLLLWIAGMIALWAAEPDR